MHCYESSDDFKQKKLLCAKKIANQKTYLYLVDYKPVIIRIYDHFKEADVLRYKKKGLFL
jgi:hypothetical protein